MFERSVIHWQHIEQNPPLLLKSIPTAIIVKICAKGSSPSILLHHCETLSVGLITCERSVYS
jgi:hypothetical protein